MSAIAAFIHWNGKPVDHAVLEAANTCVRHRCPDGAWVWVDGSVGMAQADLATLPEDEPGVAVVSGYFRIAASCRIDNRDDILRCLPRGVAPASNTDAAVILAAYEAWGEACVDRLIGDFAFIIWDAKQRSLFAARDLFGTRQLYYYRTRDTLLIASDRTQIYQDPTLPLAIDEDQLIEYLTPTFQITSGWDQGLLRNLHALPAGHTLRAKDGVVATRRFWEWQAREPDHRSEEQVLDEYIYVLQEAVRCRLRSRHHQIAIELSGGLDSSAVASLAARLADRSSLNLHTFSLVFDEVPQVDERIGIEHITRQYGLSSHFLIADRLFGPQGFSNQWLPCAITGPHDLMMSSATFDLSAAMLETGCRTVLTGLMGDAVNSGWEGVYFDLLRRGRYAEALRRLRVDWGHSPRKALGAVLYYILLPTAPLPLFRAGLAIREQLRGLEIDPPTYIPSTLRTRIVETDRALRKQAATRARLRCPVVRYTLEDILAPMIALTHSFPQPVDRRHPFTDRRLLEMVLSMPQELKWQQEERKVSRAFRWHHRKAMAGILPNSILAGNSKVDFRPVLRHNLTATSMINWLRQDSKIHIVDRGYVSAKLFEDQINRSAEPEGYLMTMLCLEAWLRSLAPGGAMRRLIPARCSPA